MEGLWFEKGVTISDSAKTYSRILSVQDRNCFFVDKSACPQYTSEDRQLWQSLVLIEEFPVERKIVTLARRGLLDTPHTIVREKPILLSLFPKCFVGDQSLLWLEKEEGVHDAADFRGKFPEGAVDYSGFGGSHSCSVGYDAQI